MRNQRGWVPLLDGELADRAREALEEIAGVLVERAAPSNATAVSLAEGLPGQALLFDYLDQLSPDHGHGERSRQLLDAAVASLAVHEVPPSLYAGFTGVAWASEIVGQQLDDSEDPNEQIDEVLLDLLATSPWHGTYDLISGLAGYAVYGLERLRRPVGRMLLERVLDRFEETAERTASGVTWKALPHVVPESNRRLYPEGHYNLGVAHGVPGIIAVLAPMVAAGIGGSRARTLLDGAVAWLLAQQRTEVGSRFPAVVAPGIPPDPARFAWCYGDPGIAAVLLAAAHVVGEPTWEREALAIARHAAAEPVTRADVFDGSLCHGAAGVAHLFNRIYQLSGDLEIAAASRRWFARAFELRRPEGIAGFASVGVAPGDPTSRVWVVDAGLLTGAVGVALALASALGSVEPEWDRILGVSSARPISSSSPVRALR